MNPMHVDVVSDVVCPWCVIGYRQLLKAADNIGLDLEVSWHPFELNPQMAPEGENLREHLAQKYGTTLEGSIKARANLTQLGTELGFTFNYADDMRMYNTWAAHQLLHWAGEQVHQTELKEALFAAFFTHRRDVSDPEVLADAAKEAGLDRAGAIAVLESRQYAEAVREEQKRWVQLGISAVPAMVFPDGRGLLGAQGIENYEAMLASNRQDVSESI